MKKTLTTLLQYVVFLGFGIAIIYYMSGKLTPAEKQEMLDALVGVRYWLLIPTLVAGSFSHYFRAMRWKLLLEPLHIRPATINVTLSVLIGYLANLVIPRAGEVAKCTVLARYEKVPADRMVGTIVAERAFDLACLVLVTVIAFTAQADIIGDYAHDLFSKMSTKTNVLMIALAGIVAVVLLLAAIYQRVKHSKVGRFIKGLGDGVRSILHLKKRGAFLLYTVLIWSMYLVQIWLGFKAMAATDELGFLAGLVVLVFGSIGMITTQGGIGAYTYLVAKILLFYGISEAAGQAYGWMSWLVQTFIILILGITALIALPIYNRRKSHGQNTVDTA